MKVNKVKVGVAAIAVLLFAVFFYWGYNFGLRKAIETFPEPEEIWAKEEGVRINSGVSPDVIRLSDGSWRMYYTVKEGIVSAVSQDGKTWTKEQGVRVAPASHSRNQARIGSATVMTLKDGTFRMLFEASDEKQTIFEISSATSKDGLDWKKEGGARVSDTNKFDQRIAASPDAVKTESGSWRLYYSDGDTIKLAVSGDEGLNWNKQNVKGLPAASIDPSVIIMPDGVYRMYFVRSASADKLDRARILSARSNDGFSWSVERGIRVAADKGANMVMDPDVVLSSLGKMRMYYTQLDKGLINGKGTKAPRLSIRSAGLELM